MLAMSLNHAMSLDFGEAMSMPFDDTMSMPFDDGMSLPFDFGMSMSFDDGMSMPFDDGMSLPFDFGMSMPFDFGMSMPLDDTMSMPFDETMSVDLTMSMPDATNVEPADTMPECEEHLSSVTVHIDFEVRMTVGNPVRFLTGILSTAIQQDFVLCPDSSRNLSDKRQFEESTVRKVKILNVTMDDSGKSRIDLISL
jgi:hypothetical protein